MASHPTDGQALLGGEVDALQPRSGSLHHRHAVAAGSRGRGDGAERPTRRSTRRDRLALHRDVRLNDALIRGNANAIHATGIGWEPPRFLLTPELQRALLDRWERQDEGREQVLRRLRARYAGRPFAKRL